MVTNNTGCVYPRYPGEIHVCGYTFSVVVDEDEKGDGVDGVGGGSDMALSEEEVNTTVMQLCQRQWYQHRRRQHPHRGIKKVVLSGTSV